MFYYLRYCKSTANVVHTKGVVLEYYCIFFTSSLTNVTSRVDNQISQVHNNLVAEKASSHQSLLLAGTKHKHHKGIINKRNNTFGLFCQ